MASIRRFGKIALGLFGLGITAVGVLFTFAPHPPATPKQVQEIAELEAHLEGLVASGNPPGLSIAVVKDGELVYHQAFGMADGPRGKRATVDTVYHWWSMTKIATAIAILQ